MGIYGRVGYNGLVRASEPLRGAFAHPEDEERLSAELEAFRNAADMPFDEETEARLDAEFEALKRAGREFSDAIKYGKDAKEWESSR